MQVLMTTDTVGGVFTYSVQLAAWLSAAGVKVVLASMGPPLSPEQHAAASQAGAEVVESSYRLEWMDDPWPDVERSGQWLLDLERSLRPDVVHLNGYAHGALPWRAPAVVVAHSCVCSWWEAVLAERAPARYDRYRAEVRRGLGRADVTVAPTRAMLDSLVQQYGPPRRSLVIHNGIRLPSGAGRAKEPMILSAGRVWDRAKNIVQLEQAASELPWPVLVAGDVTGPDGQEAPALARLERLGFLPPPVLAEWLERAAIFALPARYEPFGLSVLEAAAARCALVLGDLASLRELWGDAALYVDARDPGALADALGALIRAPDVCRRMGERAHQRAQRYGLERMGESYLALYRSLAANARREPGLLEMEMLP